MHVDFFVHFDVSVCEKAPTFNSFIFLFFIFCCGQDFSPLSEVIFFPSKHLFRLFLLLFMNSDKNGSFYLFFPYGQTQGEGVRRRVCLDKWSVIHQRVCDHHWNVN